MAISSAITPYTGSTSTAIVKPQQSLSGIVPVEKNTETVVVTVKDIRTSVLKLLRKRQQRDRLEQKFYNLQDTLDKRKKAEKEEKKSEKGKFLGKLGSGIAGKAKAVGGDLFDAVGKLLGFVALDWISKPENQQIVQAIVEGIGQIFKFIDWFVTGSVDNLLSGFTKLVAGDTLLERFVGFFQMAAGFMGLRYFLDPTLIVTDLTKAIKFIKGNALRKLSIFNKKLQKFGLKKALKFAFPRLSKILSRFTGLGSKILNGISKKLGVGKVGNLFGKITTALLRKIPALGAAKKAIFHILKPVTKFLTGIPFVGGLISFGVNMLLGDPPGKAGVKAIGSGLGSWLGAGLGTLLLPGIGTFIGGFLGGLVGDWLGSRFYDLLKGKAAKKPSKIEETRQEAAMAAAKMKQKSGGGELSDANLLEISGQLGNNPETKKPYTIEEVKKLLSDKPEETVTTTTTTTTTGDNDANISLTNTDYMNLMIETMDKGGITDKNERIMFMAQVGHESGDGLYMEEIASGADYEGRSDLGNTQPGDGKRFKGRGYIQITGRANYKRYGPMIGVPDAVENPEKLAQPQNAAKVALAYWKDRVDRDAAKKGMDGMNTVTRNINGGLNGLDDRIAKFNKYSNMSLRGQGGGNPSNSPIPNRVSSIASIPKQPGSSRSSIMKDLSTNVIQSKMIRSMGRRGGTTIVINKAGSQVINKQTTSTPVGLNNSNKPQSVKRGI
jgi:putative chitinase